MIYETKIKLLCVTRFSEGRQRENRVAMYLKIPQVDGKQKLDSRNKIQAG